MAWIMSTLFMQLRNVATSHLNFVFFNHSHVRALGKTTADCTFNGLTIINSCGNQNGCFRKFLHNVQKQQISWACISLEPSPDLALYCWDSLRL